MSSKVVIDHFNQLAAIKEDWGNIHKDSSTRSPFLSYNYIMIWYSCFASPEDVRVYHIRSGNRTIGFMPLVIKRNKGFRELRNLFNDHCFHPNPLIAEGYEAEFQEVFLNALISDKRKWDLFRNRFSYSFSSLPGLFSDDNLDSAHISWKKITEPTYSISLNMTFEEYVEKVFTKKMRSNMKLSKNRLARTESYFFLHYQGPEALEYWPLFLEVEDSGWKGTGGTSINKENNNTREYYNKLVELLARSGDLHLYFLKVKNKVVAAAFGYCDSDVFQYSKSGYDEGFAELGPTTLLYMYLIEDIICRFPAIRRFHFFPWDYGYKHRFVNEKSECIETIMYSPTVSGSIINAITQVKDKVRKTHPGIINQARKYLQRFQGSKG